MTIFSSIDSSKIVIFKEGLGLSKTEMIKRYLDGPICFRA
jgi:hypothetical protein